MKQVVANEYPKIDLTTFFLSISSAAFHAMGLIPRQDGGPSQPDLSLARQNIDLLELMDEKTRGNRTPDEDKLLDRLLYETRMQYIEAEKRQQSGSSAKA